MLKIINFYFVANINRSKPCFDHFNKLFWYTTPRFKVNKTLNFLDKLIF